MKNNLILAAAILAATSGLGLDNRKAFSSGYDYDEDEEREPYKYYGKRVELSDEELEAVRSMTKKERKAFMNNKRREVQCST